jgi:hypothetical protein
MVPSKELIAPNDLQITKTKAKIEMFGFFKNVCSESQETEYVNAGAPK